MSKSFRHHPEVLRNRALLTEGLYFQKLTHSVFDEIWQNIDRTFVDRDRLLEFVIKEDLLGDYEKFLQQKENET
ncbi:hypothetical protein [Leptospira alstonii]|uniref:Uncharacterized protein n=1 Tax=Leptospira alstonii serovar Sichuan str. 79601 TaxID=1218565 RepID=M6CTX5_9LEPT|nr:hypothetical protein [Leptospira alstonii]AGS80512.1 hypothetical protein LEP1GSC193_0730 [Leptospira phage vB_LalZ_80412-LE1]EMJ95377.1 hypothetical protein LEP1GSC194_3529 [Leptospira alstonii serovar Sichuan str. 79601]